MFPDIVAATVAWLAATSWATDPAGPVPVVVDIPADRAEQFLQVRRIGGPAAPPVRDRPSVDFRSWAPTAELAMARLLEVRTVVWQLSGTQGLGPGLTVYDVSEIMGPRNANDPATGTPLAIFTASLSVRADDAIQFTN